MKNIFKILNNIVVKLLYLFILIYLLIFIPCLWGYKPLVVISRSMEPTLKMGGILYYHEYNYDDFEKGDVLVFKTGVHTVSHRIVDRNKYGFITKGDANKSNDPSVVEKEKILGLGTNWCIPFIGYFADFIYNHKIILYLIIGILLIQFVYQRYYEEDS